MFLFFTLFLKHVPHFSPNIIYKEVLPSRPFSDSEHGKEKKMKAGIYLGKEDVEIRDLDLPEAGDNDVLIQNLYSSICGTDVAVFMNDRIPVIKSRWVVSLDTKPSPALSKSERM